MALSYKCNPPLRYPLVEPLHYETYIDAMKVQKHMLDLYRRVDYARSLVDDGPPRCVVNVRLKLKRLLSEGERLAKIERDNKFMLTNILNVMKGPAYVDHYHTRRLPEHTNTLNFTARRLMLNRVNRENSMMLERIRKTKTSYSRVQMLTVYQKRRKYQRQRAEVYDRWNKLAPRRRQYIFYEQFQTKDYKALDLEGLKIRTELTHMDCIPSCPLPEDIQPLRVPYSCRRAPGATDVDHQRCLIPLTGHISFVPWQRSPRPPKDAGFIIRETKATMLRSEMIRQKIQAMTPEPAVIRSRPVSPSIMKKGQFSVQETKATKLRAEMLKEKLESAQIATTTALEKKGKKKKSPEKTEKKQEGEGEKKTEGEGEQKEGEEEGGEKKEEGGEGGSGAGQPTTPDGEVPQSLDGSSQPPASDGEVPQSPDGSSQPPTSDGEVPQSPDGSPQPPTFDGDGEVAQSPEEGSQPPTSEGEEESKNKNQSALRSCSSSSSVQRQGNRTPETDELIFDMVTPTEPTTSTNTPYLPPLIGALPRPRNGDASSSQTSLQSNKQPASCKGPPKNWWEIRNKNGLGNLITRAGLENRSSGKDDSRQQKLLNICSHLNQQSIDKDTVSTRTRGTTGGLCELGRHGQAHLEFRNRCGGHLPELVIQKKSNSMATPNLEQSELSNKKSDPRNSGRGELGQLFKPHNSDPKNVCYTGLDDQDSPRNSDPNLIGECSGMSHSRRRRYEQNSTATKKVSFEKKPGSHNMAKPRNLHHPNAFNRSDHGILRNADSSNDRHAGHGEFVGSKSYDQRNRPKGKVLEQGIPRIIDPRNGPIGEPYEPGNQKNSKPRNRTKSKRRERGKRKNTDSRNAPCAGAGEQTRPRSLDTKDKRADVLPAVRQRSAKPRTPQWEASMVSGDTSADNIPTVSNWNSYPDICRLSTAVGGRETGYLESDQSLDIDPTLWESGSQPDFSGSNGTGPEWDNIQHREYPLDCCCAGPSHQSE